jgi:hypothetical protein
LDFEQPLPLMRHQQVEFGQNVTNL